MKRLIALMLLAASPALAHPKLTGSDPVANAKVKAPKMIRLSFSEKLEPVFSGASLTDPAGNIIPVPTSVAGSTITLIPMSMKPGRYKIDWHSVGRDTHRVTGSFRFEVTP